MEMLLWTTDKKQLCTKHDTSFTLGIAGDHSKSNGSNAKTSVDNNGGNKDLSMEKQQKGLKINLITKE